MKFKQLFAMRDIPSLDYDYFWNEIPIRGNLFLRRNKMCIHKKITLFGVVLKNDLEFAETRTYIGFKNETN